jgi:hypothetical protein
LAALIKALLFIAITMLATVPAQAGVYIDTARDAIIVVDYPPSLPCTLERLAAMDRACGWGRVKYDSASQTCALTGNLIIGANDGSETVFQVGGSDRPRETLIMHGNLYVHPYFIQGENGEIFWKVPKRMNALVLGDRTNQSINATLLFACTPTNRWSLFVGKLPWLDDKLLQWGGGLYVYNSRIEPLDSASGCEIGDNGRGVYMGSTVLENARIAGVKGMLYGMEMSVYTPELKDYSIRNTVFERVEFPLANGLHKLYDCKFINCGTVIFDRGGINAELTGCIFQGNDRNWSLTYTDKGVVLVDCEWDQPRLGDVQQTWTNRAGKVQVPKLIVRRQTVVTVQDAAGRPVANAEVVCQAEQEGDGLPPLRMLKTDAQGRTPAPGTPGVLMLTDYILTALAGPESPALSQYSYTLTASAGGKTAQRENFRPERAAKPVVLQFPK